MKIAIVVHGRFFAFDLARALLERGRQVTVFTNYPKWAAARFGLPPERVRSFWPHGVVARIAWSARDTAGLPYPERWLHEAFGRWAAAGVTREDWDAVLCMSGVAEELLRRPRRGGEVRLLARTSAHIRAQARLLGEEAARTGVRLDRPSPWMIAREEREYALADRVVTPSSFARRSFVEEGVAADRLWLLPLGVSVTAFRASPEAVDARCRRIASGDPLHVVNVGTFSLQKGMWDLARVVERLDPARFRFSFVGPVAPEATALARKLDSRTRFVPKQPQANLRTYYAGADVFVLPTIQDGFAVVLSQAAAAGLPILTTPNGAGADLVEDGVTGWVLPIRAPEAFAERLRWCDEHRAELAGMVRRIHSDFKPRDWSQVAADLEGLLGEAAPARGDLALSRERS